MGLDYGGILLKGVLGGLLAAWPIWLAMGAVVGLRLLLTVLERRRLAAAGMPEIDRMDGRTSEARLEVLFADLGYSVERTPYRGDWGGDLVLRSKDGVRTVVQAKRYQKAVGVRAVQEAVAAKAKYGCTEAMVVTNSRFTRQAEELAHANRVRLWGRDRLADALREARRQGAPVAVAAATPAPPPPPPGEVCALCGAELSPRVVRYCREHAGRFVGGLYCFQHQRKFE